MRDLEKQEQFELEALELLNTKHLLDSLVFCGGTMLRLCFGLNRFSVDLDFWVVKKLDFEKLYKKIKEAFGNYTIKDAVIKRYTLLFEIKSPLYPRSLKIEIRKETKTIMTEQAIAYSRFSDRQVLLEVVSLTDMMKAKITAFLQRKEIRDVFDIEFLYKKGIPIEGKKEALQKLLIAISGLKKQDYTVKLGALLDERERKYYISENFKVLKMALVVEGHVAEKL